MSSIIQLFSSIAIIIACSGLFALSLFASTRRRKEVGIRKVLGADSLNLFWNLSKGILTSIFIAGLLATPLSYIFTTQWLDNYANRIDFGLPYLLIPIVIIVVLSIVTFTYNLVRTIKVNPAEILRQD